MWLSWIRLVQISSIYYLLDEGCTIVVVWGWLWPSTDAVEKAFPGKEEHLPEDMVIFAAKCVLPEFVMDAFDTVFGRLDRNAQLERAKHNLPNSGHFIGRDVSDD